MCGHCHACIVMVALSWLHCHGLANATGLRLGGMWTWWTCCTRLSSTATGWCCPPTQRRTRCTTLSTPHAHHHQQQQQGCGANAVCDDDTAPIALVASHFDDDGMLRCRGRRLALPRLPAPFLSTWWAAGLSFSRGDLLTMVPYIPNVPGLFFGEEPVMLLRMWLAGWDVYCPTHTVVFHQWSRRAVRPTPATVHDTYSS